jgi:hypothetical protein
MKVSLALAAALAAAGRTADAGKIELKTTLLKSTTRSLLAEFSGSTSSDCLYQYIRVLAVSNVVKTPGTSTPGGYGSVKYQEVNSCTQQVKEGYLYNPTSLSVTGNLQKGFQVSIEGTGSNLFYCESCNPDDYFYDCDQCEDVPISINATLTPTSASYSDNCVTRRADSGLFRSTDFFKGQVKDATVKSLRGYVGDSTPPPTLEDVGGYGLIHKITSGYLEITKPA